MAIFTGEPPFVGTRGGITIYRCGGQWRVRRCNRLCTKRVKTSAEFAGLRRYAHWLAIAAPLAAEVYRTLPDCRKRSHYQRLAGKAIQYVKDGKSSEDVMLLLLDEAAVIGRELQPEKAVCSYKPTPGEVLVNLYRAVQRPSATRRRMRKAHRLRQVRSQINKSPTMNKGFPYIRVP
ncbi:hypothetical protein HNQ91_004982 [Filimonas zeae]|uniref:hypothetical protein n=1 Tax=Filimonas zeae TaxID=1737353 RepID=UPI00166D8575|nr:hypothetical protein [Filimonas zeae]MDR6341905.1 hypothetical protein [Filimonas zeae]